MRAKRSLGQNFLVGTHYPQKIVDAVAPRPGESLIEIGPGHGALTGLLLDSGADLFAIELDRDLAQLLASKFGDRKNFHLVESDAMKIDYCHLVHPAETARVVANLPYNVSTPILRRLIDHRRCLTEMILMLQREVVDRITAGPGNRDYGYLSVLVQYYCEAERLFDVPPGAFKPAPKVVSSVIRLRFRKQNLIPLRDEDLFIELVKVIFAQRRKTIFNNLRAGYAVLGAPGFEPLEMALEAAHIDPTRRAETLTIAEMSNLADQIFLRIR